MIQDIDIDNNSTRSLRSVKIKFPAIGIATQAHCGGIGIGLGFELGLELGGLGLGGLGLGLGLGLEGLGLGLLVEGLGLGVLGLGGEGASASLQRHLSLAGTGKSKLILQYPLFHEYLCRGSYI